jgi:hypothetical protein
MEESEVHKGDKKLLKPIFPPNGSADLWVMKPDPYKETVDVPMIGIFLGDEEVISKPRLVTENPTD